MCRLRLLVSVLAASVPATGCDRGPVVRVPGRTVVLTATDYRLHPQRLRVAAGRVTFRVTNRGRLPHNWVLARRGRVRGRVYTLLPGRSGAVTVRLRPGAYRMYSSAGHDEQLGQYGTVSVR